MKQISQDWEVVDRKLYRPPGLITSMFMLVIWLFGDGASPYPSTWTVRRKTTGIVKRVTASTEPEAAQMIASENFDCD
jgi:hypothetical protein